MGWEYVGKAPRPRNAVTLGIYRSGKHAVTGVLSVPSTLVKTAWATHELFTVMRGNGEHRGKLAVMPDSEGRYKLQEHSFQHLLRFPARGCSVHSAELVPFLWEDETLIVTLPEWAMPDGSQIEKPQTVVKPNEPVKQPKQRSEPAPPPPAPEPIEPAGEAEKPPLPEPAPVGGEPTPHHVTPKRPDPDKQRLPAPRPASATMKGKDWTPDAPVRQGNQVLNGKQPISWEKAADRQTELARKGPQSKLSETEVPPSWRGKPHEPPAIAKTGKADISLAGGYLMIGSVPTSVPKHLRPGLARLIDRFGEVVSIELIGRAKEVDEMRNLLKPRFTIISSAGDCLLQEA